MVLLCLLLRAGCTKKMMHLSTVFFVGSSLSATVKIVIFAVGRMLPGKESFFPL
jgi:hypothetical protein